MVGAENIVTNTDLFCYLMGLSSLIKEFLNSGKMYLFILHGDSYGFGYVIYLSFLTQPLSYVALLAYVLFLWTKEIMLYEKNSTVFERITVKKKAVSFIKEIFALRQLIK